MIVSLLAGTPSAQQAGGERRQAEKQRSIFDRIWMFTKWYEDDRNPVVQRVLFSGRFQLDYATLKADEGDLTEWNIRRMRLGNRVTLFRSLMLHGEADLNPQEADPFYVRLTDFYLEWTRSAGFALTVGKQGVGFTLDGSTSSKDLLTIDRSNLANNIWFSEEYMPGISVAGTLDVWNYQAGVYSAGKENREFGEFNGGYFTLGVLGYDFAQSLGVKQALLAGQYVYQHPDADVDPADNFTRPLDHVGSLTFTLDAGRWGARTDLSAASGSAGQSDLWGFMAMPFVNVTEKFQIVGRYTFVGSQSDNGVRLATYESRLVSGRGNRYDELYLGANYFFYGHRLKLQSGVQFADMNDDAGDGGAHSGVSWVTGLRVGW